MTLSIKGSTVMKFLGNIFLKANMSSEFSRATSGDLKYGKQGNDDDSISSSCLSMFVKLALQAGKF